MESFSEIQMCTTLESLNSCLANLSVERRDEIAKMALNTFLARNWCGLKEVPVIPDTLKVSTRDALSFDVNKPFSLVRSLEFLLLAKVASIDCSPSVPLTSFRVALTWQKILEEPAEQLQVLIEKVTADASSWHLSEVEWTEFWLEKASSHLNYYEYEKNEEAVQKALKHAGLEVELTGEMGKRTRWQHKILAQLAVKANSSVEFTAEDEEDIPVNVQMNDDTLFESIAFENMDRKRLTGVQLCCLLALQNTERWSTFNDEIMIEKCQAYLDEIISQRCTWSVQTAALMARSEIEKNKKRKVERACGQTEYIVKVMDGVDDPTFESSKLLRTYLLLASSLPPWWRCRVIHAQILISLGCVSEALLSYEKLEMFDQVVDCFKALGQLEKAEGLIRTLLVERPEDSSLYCCLGDITLDVSYYNKAIEVSGDRSARAHRSLGYLLMQRHQYKEAYTHLRRSLDLQPIQLGCWYNAGHCAWKTELFAEAVSCYHRCVSLEPEHFEAWNNLSAAYTRLGQKDRSRRILQEALKFNYEHANVWENYLLICVDTSEFSQAIRAYHRLLDLKKQVKDDELLEIIAKAVLRLEHGCGSEVLPEVRTLKDETVKLFARITTQQTLSAVGWRCFAELKKPKSEDVTAFERYVQLLEKSLKADSNKMNWVKDLFKLKSVLETAVLLSEARLKLVEMKGSEEAEKHEKSRIRMSLKPLISIAAKEYDFEEMKRTDEKIQALFEHAKEILDAVAL